MPRFSLILFFLCTPFFLLAQQEDQTTIAVHYGFGHSTARLARTNINANLDDTENINLQGRRVKWMEGRSGGISLRHNTNGRVITSATADFFYSSDRAYEYATIPSDNLRLPVRLAAGNRFYSLTGSLGLNYRITPLHNKLDVQFGVAYNYSLYRHEYASYLEFQGSEAGLRLVEEDRENINSNRQGGSVTGRISYPLVAGLGLTFDVRYGLEAEEGTFDQFLRTQLGVIYYFK